MKRALLLATLVGLLAAGAATAATPAQYRSHLNRICRGYTPKLKQLKTTMVKAQQAKDPKSYGTALGQFLFLGLDEDAQIEKVAVPAALRTRMAPIIDRLKTIDGRVRAAIIYARAGDGTNMSTQLHAVDKLAVGLNAKLDAAGLRDCGSNQQ